MICTSSIKKLSMACLKRMPNNVRNKINRKIREINDLSVTNNARLLLRQARLHLQLEINDIKVVRNKSEDELLVTRDCILSSYKKLKALPQLVNMS